VPTSTDANGDATANIQLLPSSLVLPRDVQYVSVRSGRAATAPDLASVITYTTYFNASRDLTVSLPDSFSLGSYVVASRQPYPRLGAQWTPTDALPLYVLTTIGPNAAGNTATWTCFVTGKWVKGAAHATFAFPDLSEVSGWSNHFALGTGADVQAYLSLSGVNSVDLRKANLVPGVAPSSPQPGDEVALVNKTGVYVPLP
jgi:hypothetical protein